MKKFLFYVAVSIISLFAIQTSTRTVLAQCTGGATCCQLGYSCQPTPCGGLGQPACDCGIRCVNLYGGACVQLGGGCSAVCNSIDDAVQSSSCALACVPSCSAPYCGQSNGCGGSCSSADVGNWGAPSCGGCYNPGGCSWIQEQQDCTQTDPCGNVNSYTQACSNWNCNECGPFGYRGCGDYYQTFNCSGPISGCDECGPNYGPWGACTAPTFSRSRTLTWDCQGDTINTEACYGTVYGTFFDASIVSDCATYSLQPAIAGVDVTVTAQVNHTTAYPTTTDSSGNYNRSTLPVPDTYDLTYDLGTQADNYIIDPPKLLCDGALTGISLTAQGQTLRRRVGLWKIYGGWFQVHGADVYADAGITIDIPATCTQVEYIDACHTEGGNTPLIVPNADGSTGVAFHRSGDLEVGEASNAVVSSNNWQANSGYFGRRYDYDFFNIQTADLDRGTWDGTGVPSGSADDIYTSSGSITTSFDLAVGDTVVILHDGDLTIDGNMDVPVGAFLAIISSGSITFDSSTTSVEGVFIADSLSWPSTGDEVTEQRFIGEGTFVGWDGISLERDRGTLNNEAPTEEFIFRPDFVINAPVGIRTPQITWQEVAP